MIFHSNKCVLAVFHHLVVQQDTGQRLVKVGLLLVVDFSKNDQPRRSQVQVGFLTLKAMFGRHFLKTAVV